MMENRRRKDQSSGHLRAGLDRAIDIIRFISMCEHLDMFLSYMKNANMFPNILYMVPQAHRLKSQGLTFRNGIILIWVFCAFAARLDDAFFFMQMEMFPCISNWISWFWFDNFWSVCAFCSHTETAKFPKQSSIPKPLSTACYVVDLCRAPRWFSRHFDVLFVSGACFPPFSIFFLGI